MTRTRHRLLLAGLVALLALLAASCASGAPQTAQLASCVDIGRDAQLVVSTSHCTALSDLGILCDDGRPECGEATGPADRVRLCQAINIEYFAGDIATPMDCRNSEEQAKLCNSGWISLDPSDRPPDSCDLPDDVSTVSEQQIIE